MNGVMKGAGKPLKITVCVCASGKAISLLPVKLLKTACAKAGMVATQAMGKAPADFDKIHLEGALQADAKAIFLGNKSIEQSRQGC